VCEAVRAVEKFFHIAKAVDVEVITPLNAVFGDFVECPAFENYARLAEAGLESLSLWLGDTGLGDEVVGSLLSWFVFEVADEPYDIHGESRIAIDGIDYPVRSVTDLLCIPGLFKNIDLKSIPL
jgi:hypothetical protein